MSTQEKKNQFKRWAENSKRAQLNRKTIPDLETSSFTELVDAKLEGEAGFELEYCQAIFRVSKNFDLDAFSRCLTILKKLSC